MTSRRSGLHITRALSAGVTALLHGTHLMSCVQHHPAADPRSVHRQASVVSSTYCRGSVPFNSDFSISEDDRLSDVDDDIGGMSYVTPCEGGGSGGSGREGGGVVCDRKGGIDVFFGRKGDDPDSTGDVCGGNGQDVVRGREGGDLSRGREGFCVNSDREVGDVINDREVSDVISINDRDGGNTVHDKEKGEVVSGREERNVACDRKEGDAFFDVACGRKGGVISGREGSDVASGGVRGDVVCGREENDVVHGRISSKISEAFIVVISSATVSSAAVCEDKRLDSETAADPASRIDNSNLRRSGSLYRSATVNPDTSSSVNKTSSSVDQEQSTCTPTSQPFKKHDSFNLSDIETSLILSTTASARFRRTSSRFALSSTPFKNDEPNSSPNVNQAEHFSSQDRETVSDVDCDEDEEDCSSVTSYDDADYIDFLWENLERTTDGLLNRTIVNDLLVNETTFLPPSKWRDGYDGDDNYVDENNASSQMIVSRDWSFDDDMIPPPSGWEDAYVDHQESGSQHDDSSARELPCYFSICPENYQISARNGAMVERVERSPPTYLEMMEGRINYTETDGYCVPPSDGGGDTPSGPPPTGYPQIAEYFASHRRAVADTQTDEYREPMIRNADDACSPPEEPEFDIKVASTDDDISDTESDTSSESSFEYASRLYKMTGGEWNNRVFPCNATLV